MKMIEPNHFICHFYCSFSWFSQGIFSKRYKISQLIHTQSIANWLANFVSFTECPPKTTTANIPQPMRMHLPTLPAGFINFTVSVFQVPDSPAAKSSKTFAFCQCASKE